MRVIEAAEQAVERETGFEPVTACLEGISL
jgi:hypothetical protein